MNQQIESLFQLGDHVAIITGAAAGIGRDTALTLAGAGADIAVLDVNLSGAQETAAMVQALGRKAVAIECNVADHDAIVRSFDQVIEALGRIDILVNNAAIVRRLPSLDTPPDVWRQLLALMPLRAYADTKDVAAAVLYLAAPASEMVTGHTLPVDGGYLAK